MGVADRIKAFVSTLAILITTVSIIALATGLVGLATSSDPVEREASTKIVIMALMFTALSTTTYIVFRGYVLVELLDAFLVVSAFWLLIPIFSAVLYSYATNMPILDSLFESMSGFSGTGLTVIDHPEVFPRVVLLWRSLTQWVGELGVVVFSGVLLPTIHRTIRSIYVAERGAKLAPTIVSTTRRLFTIYVLYTVLGVALFLLSGMDLFDSVAHSMTAIATGGMSTRSENLGYWFKTGNSLVAISAAIVMALGALNFMDLYNLTLGRLRDFVRSVEVRGFAIFLVIFTILLGVVAFSMNSPDSFWIWFFHMLSGFTTTGFSITRLSEYPDIVKMFIVLSMIFGGATFSTAGGIKIKRAVIALKTISWNVAEIFVPKSAVIVRRIGPEIIRDEELINVYSYIALYLLTLIALATAVHISLVDSGYSGFSYVDSLFETTSALSCVGLSVGITTSATPAITKIILMTAMYLGRIEFLPLYTLIGVYYRSRITL